MHVNRLKKLILEKETCESSKDLSYSNLDWFDLLSSSFDVHSTKYSQHPIMDGNQMTLVHSTLDIECLDMRHFTLGGHTVNLGGIRHKKLKVFNVGVFIQIEIQ